MCLSVQAFPREYLFIDIEEQDIVRLSNSSVGPTDSRVGSGDDSDDENFISNLPKGVDDVKYDSDDSEKLQMPPSSPAGGRMSAERRKYLKDLKRLEQECEDELDAANPGSFVVSEVKEWQEEDMRAWLYVLRDERPSDKVGPQKQRWKKFAHNLLNLYGIDRTPTECMRKVRIVRKFQ